MISEFSIIKQRKELSNTLKEIIEVLKEGKTTISEEEAKSLESTLLTVRVLDWVLSNEESSMEEFFEKSEVSMAKEMGYID